MSDKRIGVIAVVMDHPEDCQEMMNSTISKSSHIVVGRMGIPYRERGVAVVSLIVDGREDEINTLTGQLGSITGVTAKALMTKK